MEITCSIVFPMNDNGLEFVTEIFKVLFFHLKRLLKCVYLVLLQSRSQNETRHLCVMLMMADGSVWFRTFAALQMTT